MMYVAVALGGALGSVARYAVSLGAARWLGAGFPWGTLIVNVAGSFAIGLLAALVTADGRPALGGDARALVMIGILGRLHDVLVVQLGNTEPRAQRCARRRRRERRLVAAPVSGRRMARLQRRGPLQSLSSIAEGFRLPLAHACQ